MKRKNDVKKTGLFVSMREKWRNMGIQGRVFFCFLLFIILLLILLWFLQIRFLGFFYQKEREKYLRNTSEMIMRNIDHEDCAALVEHVSWEENLCILVTDENMNPQFSGEGLINCVVHRMNLQELQRLARQGEADNKCHFVRMSRFFKHSFSEKDFDGPVPRLEDEDTRFLVSVQQKNVEGKRYYVFITCLVAPVQSTVGTIRSQLWAISAILVLLGFVVSSVLSRQISNPIVKITKEAKKLSHGEYTPIAFKDVYHEVVELNTQLTQAAKDLHKVEEMQRELIANISHDLRTPLTLIEGYVEAMRDIPGENTPANMQIILDETRRLSSLVNTVLEYSKGKTVDSSPGEVYDLTESIQEIIDRYSKLMDKEGYDITFEHECSAWVDAHPLKISQIIYNLINNALTFTGAEKKVLIRQTISDDKVKIEIIDDGEGIPAEELPYIWSRYYRGKKPHVRPAAGSGLGLNIVKDILDGYHMEYGVESRQGEGSCFWFALPLAKEGVKQEMN